MAAGSVMTAGSVMSLATSAAQSKDATTYVGDEYKGGVENMHTLCRDGAFKLADTWTIW